MVLDGKEDYAVMVVDISVGGLQLALPPGLEDDTVTVGRKVMLQDVPEPFTRLLDGKAGVVAWVGVRCCGVRLERSLAFDASLLTELARL